MWENVNNVCGAMKIYQNTLMIFFMKKRIYDNERKFFPWDT